MMRLHDKNMLFRMWFMANGTIQIYAHMIVYCVVYMCVKVGRWKKGKYFHYIKA